MLLRLAPYAALAIVMLAVYWRVLRFPFIQDDWGWLYSFETERPAALLASILHVKGVLFYRPLAEIYLYLMYRVFGLNPVPFHAVALLVHFGAACLVAAIVKLLVRDRVMAWAAAFVYALAVSVVFESLLWAVGIFDLGAVFFFLLSLYLFMRGRPWASAAVYLAACLFKETAIVLPFVLLAYALVVDRPKRVALVSYARSRLLPVAIAFAAIAVVKLMGKKPLSLPISDPYAVRLTGSHVGILLSKYVFCHLQSFCFRGAIKSSVFPIALWCLGSGLALGGWLVSRRPRDAAAVRAYPFLLIWWLVALLPTLFLPNHAYRYYAIYALPAFIPLVLLALRTIVAASGLGRRPARAFVVVAAVLAVVFSASRAHWMLRVGLDWSGLVEGTNSLVRKAALVDIVRDGLAKQLPNPPKGSVIVFGNIDVWAFNKDSGPRLWYADTTISVYPVENLRTDSAGVYIDSPIESQRRLFSGTAGGRRSVDVARLFGFVLKDSELRPVKFKGLPPSVPSSVDGGPASDAAPPWRGAPPSEGDR